MRGYIKSNQYFLEEYTVKGFKFVMSLVANDFLLSVLANF
jgi:hypothetical protein